MDATPFVTLLTPAQSWFQQLGELGATEIDEGSDIWMDEQVEGGHWGHHLAVTCLVSATDHLVTLLHVLAGARIVPIRAGYTLVRGALEPALLAYWLLQPDDSHERRRRGFCAAYADYNRRREFENEFPDIPTSPPPAKSALERMKDLEVQARLAQANDGLKKPPNITTISLQCGGATLPLPELNESDTAARWLWRWLSGTAHGLMWPIMALINAATTRQVGKHKGAMFEADERLLFVSARAAINATRSGMELLVERRTVHAPTKSE